MIVNTPYQKSYMTKRKSNNIFLQLIMAMLLLFLPYYACGQKKVF